MGEINKKKGEVTNLPKRNVTLSIIIVNWNTKNLLRRCLHSIYAKTVGLDFEVVVVDNASSDRSARMVENEFGQCTIIKSKHNLGFSRANNLGLRYARGKYVLFLNPDTELRTNAAKAMVQFLEENANYGAVGCKLLNEDGSIQFTCARKFITPRTELCSLVLLNRLFPKSKWASTDEIGYWDHEDSRDVDCLSGACILIRREIIESLGGFNEQFFMYGEDIELCYRIKNNGWPIYYLATEEIFHFSGSSSNQIEDKTFSAVMQHESNYKFLEECINRRKAAEYKMMVLFGSIARILIILLLYPLVEVKQDWKRRINSYTFKKYIGLLMWSIGLRPGRNIPQKRDT